MYNRRRRQPASGPDSRALCREKFDKLPPKLQDAIRRALGEVKGPTKSISQSKPPPESLPAEASHWVPVPFDEYLRRCGMKALAMVLTGIEYWTLTPDQKFILAGRLGCRVTELLAWRNQIRCGERTVPTAPAGTPPCSGSSSPPSTPTP